MPSGKRAGVRLPARLAQFDLVGDGNLHHTARSHRIPADLKRRCRFDLDPYAIDKKVVGPAYKDVANKYRTDKTAATKLMQKVKAGGSGVWGQVPMPPNPQVKDDDLKKMVDYVLALK